MNAPRAVLAGLSGLALACCGQSRPTPSGQPIEDWEPGPPARPRPRPPRAIVVELGDSSAPPGVAPEELRSHEWRATDEPPPPRYHARYGLSKARRSALWRALEDYAAEVGYVRRGDSATWTPPENCGRGLRCVYRRVAQDNLRSVLPFALRFDKHRHLWNLDGLRVARLVLGFVQDLRYEVPDQYAFEVLPPAIAMHEGWGDCDSRTLLAALLLEVLGVDAAIVDSERHEHALVGIHLPLPGDGYTLRGKRYVVTEATGRWPIGQLPPGYESPDDWRVLPF